MLQQKMLCDKFLRISNFQNKISKSCNGGILGKFQIQNKKLPTFLNE